MGDAVGFILKGYPRLSETFIAQEIRALEARGLDIRIYSLRHPTDRSCHPVHREICAPVTYLPEYLHDEPRRVARAWLNMRRKRGYALAHRLWRRDLARDRTRNRVRRFGQALVLANELAPEIRHLHAHFLHTPASVTRYAATILGLPWSVSAHAKDIWTSPEWEIAEKLADCSWAVTCTRLNAERLNSLSGPGRVALVYHGLDLSRFATRHDDRGARDGSREDDPVRLLSVGRLVEKKGYDDLLAALAALPATLSWRLDHIGGGEQAGMLQERAVREGMGERIAWHGAQDQQAILQAYRAADLFVLASRRARNGDQDGLPNVLMEAQSQGLAVIATRFSAIPELVLDGETGRLVEPGDSAALSRAIASLAADPAERARLGAAGQARVESHFALEHCLEGLADRFGLMREAA